MFTRPDAVQDADILAALREHWGFDVVRVGYLPAGFGSHHWVATTAAAGTKWFITVDDVATKTFLGAEPMVSFDALGKAFTVAQALRDGGLTWVVAPVSTQDGGVLSWLNERFSIAVFPHLNGFTREEYASDVERAGVLSLLAQLHQVSEPVLTLARRETFELPNRSDLDAAITSVDDRWNGGPYAEAARSLLRRHVVGVGHLLDDYDHLARQALRQQTGWTLTHGEPHSANALRTDDGLRVIDWDTAMLAPPERDLWMLIPPQGHHLLERQYLDLTGHRVNRHLLNLYALWWDLSEIGGYLAQFRVPHSDTEDTQEAWRNLDHFIRADQRRNNRPNQHA